MTEKPILMCGDMVRATLDDRKFQTRRIVKFPEWFLEEYIRFGAEEIKKEIKCPYAVDRLWVRETFAIECNDGLQDVYNAPMNPLGHVRLHYDEMNVQDYFECPRYRASEPNTILGDDEDGMKWTPSIFMPRWASRINLTVKNIRVERVQEISEEDAMAEGVNGGCFNCGNDQPCNCKNPQPLYRDSYIWLWNMINGKKRGCAWRDNPWVWVVEFERGK